MRCLASSFTLLACQLNKSPTPVAYDTSFRKKLERTSGAGSNRRELLLKFINKDVDILAEVTSKTVLEQAEKSRKAIPKQTATKTPKGKYGDKDGKGKARRSNAEEKIQEEEGIRGDRRVCHAQTKALGKVYFYQVLGTVRIRFVLNLTKMCGFVRFLKHVLIE